MCVSGTGEIDPEADVDFLASCRIQPNVDVCDALPQAHTFTHILLFLLLSCSTYMPRSKACSCSIHIQPTQISDKCLLGRNEALPPLSLGLMAKADALEGIATVPSSYFRPPRDSKCRAATTSSRHCTGQPRGSGPRRRSKPIGLQTPLPHTNIQCDGSNSGQPRGRRPRPCLVLAWTSEDHRHILLYSQFRSRLSW